MSSFHVFSQSKTSISICQSIEFIEDNLSGYDGDKIPVTKLVVDGIELCNAIELVDWRADVVELTLCDCGTPGCSVAGLSRIVQLYDHIMVMRPPPRLLENYNWCFDTETDVNYRTIPVPIVLLKHQWKNIVSRFNNVPIQDELPELTQIELIHLWLDTIPFQIRRSLPYSVASPNEFIMYLKRNVIAADPGDLDECLELIESLICKSGIQSDVCATNSQFEFHSISTSPPETIRLYFDGPTSPEWAALKPKVNGFVLDNRLVILDRQDSS